MNLLYDISKYLENINTDSLCNLLLYDPRQPLLFNTGLFLVLFVATGLSFYLSWAAFQPYD